VEVTESKPPRLFDSAAVQAMQRWKFRPKIVNGQPQSQRAQQTIEFTLNQ
jgi:protein TonB